MVTPIKQFS